MITLLQFFTQIKMLAHQLIQVFYNIGSFDLAFFGFIKFLAIAEVVCEQKFIAAVKQAIAI
ncbi:MAG: hypothetical protein CMN96_01560 [Synechococcus sp. MED850]|nr:hypothetical protein [Synechococcus sp. MED850]OUW99091.1 MAG: hypothetical protein CBD89_01010 [Cyanobacteria bacterium TMED229]